MRGAGACVHAAALNTSAAIDVNLVVIETRGMGDKLCDPTICCGRASIWVSAARERKVPGQPRRGTSTLPASGSTVTLKGPIPISSPSACPIRGGSVSMKKFDPAA